MAAGELEREFAGEVWRLLGGAGGAWECAGLLGEVCGSARVRAAGSAFDGARPPAERAALRAAGEALRVEGGTWTLLCRLIEERRGRAAIGPGGRSREGVRVGAAPGEAEGELPLCPLARCATLIGWLEAQMGDPDVRAGARDDEPGLRREEAALRQMWASLHTGEASEATEALRLCALLWHAGDPGRRGPEWGDSMADGCAGRRAGAGGGARGWGADAMEDEEDKEHWIEALADEVEAGDGRRHDLWMQGCWHAGARAKDHHGPAPRLEAAIYGAMCGSAPLALQVCKTWEQTAWVLLRAWLHFKLDQPDTGDSVGVDEGGEPPSPPAVEATGGKHLCASMERRRGGQVPWQQLGTIFSRDFGGICEILGTWSFKSDRPSHHLHRLVQMDLAREDPLGMLTAIQDRVITDTERGEQEVGAEEGLPAVGEGSGADRLGDLRFAATLVVWLLTGGKSPDDRFANWSLEKAFSGEQDMANKILQLYVIHLIDRAQHDAIPVYASNLRDTMLELVYCIYFDEMLRSPIGEVQVRAYHLAREILGDVTETIALKVADKAHNYIVEDPVEQVQHKSNACEWLCKCGLLEPGHQYTLLLVKEIAMRGWKHYEAALSLLDRIPYSLDENPLHPQAGMSEAAAELHRWRLLLQSELDLRNNLSQLEAAAERMRASSEKDLMMPSTAVTHQVLQVKLQDAVRNFQAFLSDLCGSATPGVASCEVNLALRLRLSSDTPVLDPALTDKALKCVLRHIELTNEILFKANTAYKWTGVVVGHAKPEEPVFQLQLAANLEDGAKEEALCLLAASALKYSTEDMAVATPEYLDADPTFCVDLTALHMCVPRLVGLVMQLRVLSTGLGLTDPCPEFLNQVSGSGEVTKLGYFLSGSEMQEALSKERHLLLNAFP